MKYYKVPKNLDGRAVLKKGLYCGKIQFFTIKEYYNHQPVFTEKINNDSYGYLKVKLSNGDCWCIGYVGQVQKIDERYM